MDCPLILYPAGVIGTTQYYAPCACLKVCEYASCKYRRSGFLVTVQSVGATTTDSVAILGKGCGASMPLVAASNNAVVTNADLVAGSVYTIVPVAVDGVLRGIVQGI